MPNKTDDLDSWNIIQTFVQSTFSEGTLSVTDKECCKRIIRWYEKNFSDVEEVTVIYKINVVIHRIYVALEQFADAAQLLLSLPYVNSDDLAPIIPRNIPISDAIVINYIEFLLKKDISPLNAQTLLLIPNDLNCLFNYMDSCLFTLNKKHQFNYQYFAEQLNQLLDDQNQLSAELEVEFTNFFRKSCIKRGGRKFYQEFNLESEYEALFKKMDIDEDATKLYSSDIAKIKTGNWFELEKNNIRLVLVNYPQLISCMFAMKHLTYPNMILEVLSGVQDFHLILKPFADYLASDTIRGFSGSSEISRTCHTRVYFPRFYIYLFDYLSVLIENYDQLAKIPIDIIESLTQICCGLYDNLPFNEWGQQGDYHIQPLARANSNNVIMVIQLLILTQHYDKLDRLLLVAKKPISKIGPAKKIIELYEGSITNVLGIPSSRYLSSIINCFANTQEFFTFGIKYAQLFYMNFLSTNLTYSSADYAKVLRITSIFTLNYALPQEYISPLVRNIPSNQWPEIYNELLKEFHANKNPIISFFNSSQKVKENAKVDVFLARILIEITFLPELDNGLRGKIVHDFPNCGVSSGFVLEELDLSTPVNFYSHTLNSSPHLNLG